MGGGGGGGGGNIIITEEYVISYLLDINKTILYPDELKIKNVLILPKHRMKTKKKNVIKTV